MYKKLRYSIPALNRHQGICFILYSYKKSKQQPTNEQQHNKKYFTTSARYGSDINVMDIRNRDLESNRVTQTKKK